MSPVIDFRTDPGQYRHWRVEIDAAVADLIMDVDEQGGVLDGYELKLNSYDLGVDIELADIVQRMRFEHPEVGAIVLRSGQRQVFCAGANIRMLAGASHVHKVNFCKFTNETRNTFESAGQESGQHYIAAVRGSCAGGGYELALACDEIYLTDDGSSSVALPEVPLLAVLPGTGGLTRLTDKRKVRRDLADVFCSLEEGVRGRRAAQWGLVDKVIPNSTFDDFVSARAQALAKLSKNNAQSAEHAVGRAGQPIQGISLGVLARDINPDGSLQYQYLEVKIDRAPGDSPGSGPGSGPGNATLLLKGPDQQAPETLEQLHQLGSKHWMLQLARELDDALLHLRFNETELGVLLFRSSGEGQEVIAYEKLLLDNRQTDWLCREILLYWKRVLKRLDLTSRSLIALVEHGSCFAGFLAEIPFAADRSYMMEGEFENDQRPLATLQLSPANFGPLPMSNDLTRLQTRFLGAAEHLDNLQQSVGESLQADAASELGLITYAYDDIDWFDEIRVFLEERGSFSPDALTAMEANLRFAGPETMESKIFARLSAWQNWIFQRPNAVGEAGALRRYGSGKRADFDRQRV